METDIDAWKSAHPEDLWVFDKLILSKRLGYSCGPHGMPVPKPGLYVVRPAMNMMGGSRSSSLVGLEGDTYHEVPDGYFWCEYFRGPHISVDYYKGEPVLAVKGIRDSWDDLKRFKAWVKTSDSLLYPPILLELQGEYDWINCEFIGGRLIEVHLRRNPDFVKWDAQELIPVYDIDTAIGSVDFVADPDGERLGFIVRGRNA